jgi:hypothetical protein
MEFLTWLEQTNLSRWVTESPSLFAYPSILFLHTAGLAFLVGPSIAISARILGFPRGFRYGPWRSSTQSCGGGFGSILSLVWCS